MTAQSILAKGKYLDFPFRSTVSASSGNESDAIGNSLGGRVPMYMDGSTPAVIRLTHSGPNNNSTSGYSTISSRNHLFDINETVVVPEPDSYGITGMVNTSTGSYLDQQLGSLSSRSQPFIYTERTSPGDGNFSTRPSLSQIQDSRALDVADIHSLLNSDANRRPPSRQSKEFKEAKHSFNEFTDLARCKTSISTGSQNRLVEPNSSVSPCGQTEEENVDEEESRDELEENLPVTENPNLNDTQIAHDVPNKTSSKKAKKNKKRVKSSMSAKMKMKLQISNKLYQHGNMKIPPATKVKSVKDSSSKSPLNSQLSNLSGVLQAQCKPITLVKHEQLAKESIPQKLSHRSGATSEMFRPKINQIDALKFSVNSKSSRDQESQHHLPQMTINNLVQQNSSNEPSIQTYMGSDLLSTSKSFMHTENRVTYYQTTGKEIARITKVYLSEKHSGTMKDCGMEYPCAPPATPTPDQLRKVEYVPSMNDVRAQRAVKLKLQVLEKEAFRKLERQREEKTRQDKLQMKDREKELRIKQRSEIYALNKVMTELEQKRFQEFCSRKGIVI